MGKKVFVIGGGPAGYSATIYLADLGAEVTLIEKQYLGGTCLNVGCIPTKVFVEAASVYASVLNAKTYGIMTDAAPQVNGKKLAKFKNKIVRQLTGGVAYLLQNAGVEVLSGTARLTGGRTVHADLADGGTADLTADAVILATGSSEIVIPELEPDGQTVLNSTQMLEMKELPESITIVGGGVIGVEFASIFARFGKQVNIVELTDGLVPNQDREVAKDLQNFLEYQGVKVYTGTRAKEITEKDGESVSLCVETPEGEKILTTQKLLVCIGRRANLEGIGLDEAGVLAEKRFIPTNGYMQTNVETVYAIGDITSSPQLAHVGYYEARIAAKHIMGSGDERADYRAVPGCIYSYPEVAGVGMTEEQARQEFGQVKIVKESFSGNGKAMIHGENEGYVKYVMEAESGKLVGCSIIGPKATELITEPTLAVKLGLDAETFAETIHAHPSLGEVLGEAAGNAVGLKLHSV